MYPPSDQFLVPFCFFFFEVMDTTFTPMNSSNLNYDSQQAVSSIDKEYPHKVIPPAPPI
jgi:hypothetical protein